MKLYFQLPWYHCLDILATGDKLPRAHRFVWCLSTTTGCSSLAVCLQEWLYNDEMYCYEKYQQLFVAASHGSTTRKGLTVVKPCTGETIAHCSLRLYACKCCCDELTHCTVFVIMCCFYDKPSFTRLGLNAEHAPPLSLAQAHRRLRTLFSLLMIIGDMSNEYQWRGSLSFAFQSL